MKNKQSLKTRICIGTILILIIIIGVLLYRMYNMNADTKNEQNTSYDMAFYQLIDYVENVENFLAKACISTSSEAGAETLTHVWREADLAVSCLSQLPLNIEQLNKTAKFLNQVSEYSYSLSRKNIYKEELKQEDLDNLNELHKYSLELRDNLNDIADKLSSGQIAWQEVKNNDEEYTRQVDSISQISFTDIDNNFNEFAGLIYDGAFSEHIELAEKKGLPNQEISEEEAENIIKDIYKDKIENIQKNGLIEQGNISVYQFEIKEKQQEEKTYISISKKGGKIVLLNKNRDVIDEKLSREEANQIGKDYLKNIGFTDMVETYYQTQENIITINYVYEQNKIAVYPDLIKVKVALDNGEILGIESTGYLNSHEQRTDISATITKEQAKAKLNPKLEIQSEKLAIIPTEWKTEILCYEFKGKVDETEFLVYINAKNGREENILVIIETPGGVLTM
jgi:germination protein YpeB